MRPSLRVAAALAAGALSLTAFPAHADNVVVTDALNAELLSVNLGDICSGESASSALGFRLVRSGGINNQTWGNSALVTVATPGASAAAGVVSAPSASATTLGNWTTAGNGASVDVPDVNVTVAAATLAPGAAPVAGSVTLTFSASGAGASQPSTTRTDTLGVTWTTKHCDETPPVIGYTLNPPAPATGGWYGEPVSIDWTVDDPESVETVTGCADATQSTETTTAGTTWSCSASSPGGDAGPVDVNVKVDLTDPVVTPEVTGTVGANGWYTGDVTLHWAVSDALSGLVDPAACPDVVVDADQLAQSYGCSVTDNAGRSASATTQIKRDASAPQVTANVSGLAGTNDWYRSDVDVSWTITEDVSNPLVVTGCEATLVGDTAGTTLPCSVTNDAGLSTNAPVTVKVDQLAPSVTGTATGQAGTNGWFTDDVTVSWATSDSGPSGLVAGCAADVQTAETTGVTFTCTVFDEAGNSASDDVDVKLDKTAPSIDVDVTGTAGNAGWYVSDAAVDWTTDESVATPVDETACLDVVVSDTDADGYDVTCTVTNDAGLTSEETVTVKVDTLAPTVVGAATGDEGDNDWFVGDVTVAWDVTDGGSGLASDCVDDEQTAETTGVTFTCSVEDVAGNTASDSVDVKLDKTAPTVDVDVTGTTGNDGWFTSAAHVDWTATEDVATPVDEAACADTDVDDTDSDGDEVTCTVTNDAGLTAEETVTVKVDTVAPVVGYALTGDLGLAGWYVGPVGVAWTYDEDGSGVAVPCGDVNHTADTDAAGASYGCAVEDVAGNTSNTATASFTKDATAPAVTWLTGPDDGATYYFGDAVPAATCEANDPAPGSGNGDCVVTGGGTSVGSHALTATAHDVAGNEGTSTRNYTVNAWTFTGFHAPVDMGGVVNTVKAGSTVPLKFNVHKGSTEVTSGLAASGFTATKGVCGTGTEDAIETVAATGATTLRYDATAKQWIFNWATPKSAANTCWTVTYAAGGTTISAKFKLK